MTEQYTSLVDVTVPAGGDVTVPHDIVVNGVPAAPHLVQPNQATGLVVSVVTATSITVHNPGTAAASARFLCEFIHSIQSRPVDVPAASMAWQGGGGGGPPLSPLENTVFVAKNGNDGTADGSVAAPFLTVQAAMEYAYTTYVVPVGPQPSPPFTRPVVFVMPGTYDDGPLVLPPQICVQGCGFNHSRITGSWAIDARWSNYPPPGALVPNDMRSSWINVGLFGVIAIDFNPVQSNEGKLYALNCRFADDVIIAEKRVNPVSNSFTATSCEFLADITLTGIPTLLEHCVTKGGTLFITQAIGAVFADVDNIFESSGGSIGNITITSLDPTMPAYDCTFCHSAQPGTTLTLNGVYSVVKADLDAVPLQSLVVLLGGAGLNQITRANQLNWSGVTANRPPAPYIGQPYFDTSLLPAGGLPIWWNGAAWINAAGVVV